MWYVANIFERKRKVKKERKKERGKQEKSGVYLSHIPPPASPPLSLLLSFFLFFSFFFSSFSFLSSSFFFLLSSSLFSSLHLVICRRAPLQYDGLGGVGLGSLDNYSGFVDSAKTPTMSPMSMAHNFFFFSVAFWLVCIHPDGLPSAAEIVQWMQNLLSSTPDRTLS